MRADDLLDICLLCFRQVQVLLHPFGDSVEQIAPVDGRPWRWEQAHASRAAKSSRYEYHQN
jgi:hypothetical protein